MPPTSVQLTNRTVLITGGTSGIGLALARLLAARGNVVAVTGRDPAKLAAIRPGLAGVLKAMSRLAPRFMFDQLARMSGASFTTPESTP